MARIIRRLALSPGVTRTGKAYKVVKATNTLEPKVGTFLTEAEVQAEIDLGTEVTITERKW